MTPESITATAGPVQVVSDAVACSDRGFIGLDRADVRWNDLCGALESTSALTAVTRASAASRVACAEVSETVKPFSALS